MLTRFFFLCLFLFFKFNFRESIAPKSQKYSFYRNPYLFRDIRSKTFHFIMITDPKQTSKILNEFSKSK